MAPPEKGLTKAEVTAKRYREIFIGKIPYSLTEQDIEDYFSQFGQVVAVTLLRTSDGRSRGCAFIQMETVSQLDAAMSCRPISMGGQEVECLRAAFGRDPAKTVLSKKLFVGNIGGNSESTLRSYFTKYDGITNLDIPNDHDSGKKRNFAVVTFVSYEGPDKAILEENHDLGGRQLTVKKYLSKEQELAVQAKERDLGNRNQRNAGGGGGGMGRSRRDDFGGGRFGGQDMPMYYGSMGGFSGGPRMSGGGSGARDREWAASDRWAASGAGYNSFESRPVVTGGALGSYGQAAYSPFPGVVKHEASINSPQLSGYGSSFGNGASAPGGGGGGQLPTNLPNHQEFRQMLVSARVSQAAVEVLERENLLDPEVLMIMNSAELAELNLPIGDRKRLQLVFQKISASYS